MKTIADALDIARSNLLPQSATAAPRRHRRRPQPGPGFVVLAGEAKELHLSRVTGKVSVSDDQPPERIRAMKQLLTSAAVWAALVFSAPVWAQQTSPAGNAMCVPGPNPGGPWLTPYTTGPGQAPPSYRPPAALMTPEATPPPSRYEPSAPLSSSNRQQARTYSKRTDVC